jgi:arsenate reductase (glutaredoxin)
VEIWINPACSTCRTATKALDEAGVTYTVRRYLDDPPTAERPILTTDDTPPQLPETHKPSPASSPTDLPRPAPSPLWMAQRS